MVLASEVTERQLAELAGNLVKEQEGTKPTTSTVSTISTTSTISTISTTNDISFNSITSLLSQHKFLLVTMAQKFFGPDFNAEEEWAKLEAPVAASWEMDIEQADLVGVQEAEVIDLTSPDDDMEYVELIGVQEAEVIDLTSPDDDDDVFFPSPAASPAPAPPSPAPAPLSPAPAVSPPAPIPRHAAFNGDYHKNPYNFKHYGLNYLGLYVDN
ncbi:uncharacterized protein LOC110975752 [Acanthaster planci]|uniref:Uncharacterized protein LOC110975752 n=1 Tax=Acanthaster planci TaxID=133434 RepID=A0A8B7XVC0_ACAPL|nr:uncharacterized protein LOC110975752 [Acanthaster planci]